MLALFIFMDIVLLRYKSYELIRLLLVFQMVFMALNGLLPEKRQVSALFRHAI